MIERENWTCLGWTEALWMPYHNQVPTANAPELWEEDWVQLSSEMQKCAIFLGYTQAKVSESYMARSDLICF